MESIRYYFIGLTVKKILGKIKKKRSKEKKVKYYKIK